MDKILFIDGHNQIHRACIGFGPAVIHSLCEQCKDPYHEDIKDAHCVCASPWDADNHFCYGDKYTYVFNFFRNLRPHIEKFSPDKCYFCLEGRPQFRYDLYGDYKANRIIKQGSVNRQEASDKFKQAKDIILSLLKHLPITICVAERYEADDVIGSLCQDMQNEDLTIISGDTDFIQLLQRGYSHIQIYNPIKKIFMEAPTYVYIAHKALVGDKSDNIKRLVSDKKALSFCNDPDLFSKFMDTEENRALFTINKKLIEFANVPAEEIIIQEGERNFAYLQQAFSQMKFQSIVNPKSWEKYQQTFNCLKF